MFFGKKKSSAGQPSQRLLAKMTSVVSDASKLTKRIKAGRIMPVIHRDPERGLINLQKTEDLFKFLDKDGVETFQFYHYSTDLKSINPNAQIDLMKFFGDIIKLNTIAYPFSGKRLDEQTMHIVSGLLDRITVQAYFFECFLEGTDLATKILTGKISKENVHAETKRQGEVFMNRGLSLRKNLFRPDQFAGLSPRQDIPYPMALGRPYEEGQTFINGVFFGMEKAKMLLAHLAKAQADSIGRPNSMAGTAT